MRQVLLILVAFVCIYSTQSVQAAEYTVAPMAFNLNVERRDIINETVTLTNTSDRQVRLYASVHEVATDGEGVVHAFTMPDGNARATTPTSWVEISRARIVLAAGEKREIPFTIRMNPYTEPGEYSVFIGFATASNQPQATAKVMAGNAPGTLINLLVDKKQNHFLRLESFLIDKFVTNTNTETVSLRFHNPGEVATIPQGEVIFYDSKGREVAATPLNTESAKVDAANSAAYTVSLPDELPMGRYKAFLAAEYGDTLRVNLNDTTFFYVVSIPQLLAIFAGLFLLTIILMWLWYRRHHAEDDSMVPLYVQTGESPTKDHDLDLKKTYE